MRLIVFQLDLKITPSGIDLQKELKPLNTTTTKNIKQI